MLVRRWTSRTVDSSVFSNMSYTVALDNLKGHSITPVVEIVQLLHFSQSEYVKDSKAGAWMKLMVRKSKTKLWNSGIWDYFLI